MMRYVKYLDFKEPSYKTHYKGGKQSLYSKDAQKQYLQQNTQAKITRT